MYKYLKDRISKVASFFLQLKQLLFGTGVPSKNVNNRKESEPYEADDDDNDSSDDDD